nr:uridine phosphorylase 1 [Hymenolepis microstoma]
MSQSINVCNPNLDSMPVDVLYHLGLSTDTIDVKRAFGDVKFVVLGGSHKRMQKIAEILLKEFNFDLPVGTGLSNISWTTDRYVICMDCAFNDFFQLKVMGKVVKRPAELDGDFARGLVETAKEMQLDFTVVAGKTMCADDFYEEQGRLDGAICDYTEAEKMAFLQKAYDLGVRNLEMESLGFAAFCQRLKIRAAVICATMVNRLESDQISTPVDTMHMWQERPLQILIAYMKKALKTSE